MNTKLNKKGFTLIELLATIVILGLISTITIVAITSYYTKGREKSEEIFVEQLKGYVDDYISLYGTTITFESGVQKQKCYKDFNDEQVCSDVYLYNSKEKIDLKYITDYITDKELINPKTNISCSEDNEKVTIYRDTDYVYCFKIEIDKESSCLSNNIDTCAGIYK